MANNKVEFGISNLHIGTYEDNNGTVTLGQGYHLPGAVSFTPEQSAESNTFYADNIAYWSEYTTGPFEGDLEVARFTDEFKTQFLGYKRLTNGGLANVKNPVTPRVWIGFDVIGDVEPRRAIFYNCSFGAIKREYKTVEDKKEPATETIGVTCTGDNPSGVTKATLKPGDTGYATLFTNPAAPVVDTESTNENNAESTNENNGD